MLYLLLQPASKLLHASLVIFNFSFLQLSYTLVLLDKNTPVIIGKQTMDCLTNERKVCCYPNDIAVWRNCSTAFVSFPFSCQHIRDDNGIHAAHYNQTIKNDRSIYTPSHVRNLRMVPHFKNNSAAVWNISWHFPDNIKGLRGFLLEVKWQRLNEEGKEDKKGIDKWVFKVSNPSSNQHITHLCSRIYPMDKYIATVYSLPNGETTTLTKTLVENKYNEGPNKCADKWKGLIRYMSVNDTTTKVCFFAAPSHYNFKFYEFFIGAKFPTWHLRIEDVETSANKVFCEDYNLMSARYNIMLVARLDENTECLCEGGCNYNLNFQVSFQPTPKTTSTIQTSTPTITITDIPTSAPDNNLVVITTTVVFFIVALIFTIVIFLYFQHRVLTNLFNGWFSTEYCLIVVDIGTDKDLLNKVTLLAKDIQKETHKNVKSVVIESNLNDQNSRFLKNKKTYLLSFLKRKRKNELKPTYLIKGKNKNEIEKVLNLLRNAENVLLVHTEKSYKDILYSMSSGGSRDNVCSEIVGIYHDNYLLKWQKEIDLDENIYEDIEKEPEVLPPIFHLSEDINFLFPLKSFDNVFLIPQDIQQLLARIKTLPDTQEVSWVFPDENAQVDDSIARNKLKEFNEEFDSFIMIEGNNVDVYERKGSLEMVSTQQHMLTSTTTTALTSTTTTLTSSTTTILLTHSLQSVM